MVIYEYVKSALQLIIIHEKAFVHITPKNDCKTFQSKKNDEYPKAIIE
jgi:hypothetical protein